MSLKAWIEESSLASESVTVCGQTFLVKELDLLTRSETMKANAADLEIECRLLAACVYDPESDQPVEADWTWWKAAGQQVASPLIAACLRVNGLNRDEVAEAVKS